MNNSNSIKKLPVIAKEHRKLTIIGGYNAVINSLCLFIFTTSLCVFSVVSSAQSYDIVSLLPIPLTASIKKSGTLNFKRTTKLAFNSGGFLKNLMVDEGSLIIDNQLLASLDIVELIEQKNMAYARLRQAKSDVERAQILLNKNLSSQQELEDRKTSVDTARAAYKIAYYNLEKAEIRAPFNGVVIARFSEVGEWQGVGSTFLEVAALDNNLVVNVALTGHEVSDLTIGTKVDVTLTSNKVVQGKISKISVLAEPVSHLFTVEVLLPTVTFNNGAIAGQLAEVNIAFFEEDSAYKVPVEALISIDDEGMAVVITESIENIKEIQKRRFTVLKLDNHFVYLTPDNTEEIVSFVVRGWQHLDPPMFSSPQ